MKAAIDLGYGSVKALIDGEKVLFPSAIVLQRKQDLFDPIKFDDEDQEDDYMNDLIDHMDVTISSNAVQTPGRFLVGVAARDSKLPLKTFDVNDMSGKSESDLAMIINLSCLAAMRVKEAWENEEDLSKQLETDVFMTTALPVLEGKRDGASERYEKRFTETSHVVTFHNFKEPISVKLTFKQVIVALEGETARYAIASADGKLKASIKKDFDKHYPELASEVSADDLLKAPNTLLIDIGEGTTDFVVFSDGKINFTSSTSLAMGYGNALEEAVSQLQADKVAILDRTALSEFVSRPVSPLSRSRQERAKEAIRDQFGVLNDEITVAASQTLRKAASGIDLVYVMGGGSIGLADSGLREALEKKLAAFSGGIDVPVIWIVPAYAQALNALGLETILNKVM